MQYWLITSGTNTQPVAAGLAPSSLAVVPSVMSSEMDREIENLLGKLCVDLGFCLPPKEQDRIASIGTWEASEFAKDVISSEGLNPEYEQKWFREIRNRFIAHFGSNEYESKNS